MFCRKGNSVGICVQVSKDPSTVLKPELVIPKGTVKAEKVTSPPFSVSIPTGIRFLSQSGYGSAWRAKFTLLSFKTSEV